MPWLETLALSYLLIFLINLAPAFSPPTWAIVAFFLIRFHLPLLPLTVGAAVAASAGRLSLALLSRRWGLRLLSPKQRTNMRRLGSWLMEKPGWAPALIVLMYSFGPIPSNQLFIAAGLTGIRLAPIVGAFLAGRMVSYTVSAFTAGKMADQITTVLATGWSNIAAVAVQLFALVALAVFTQLDWPKLLHLPAPIPRTESVPDPTGRRDRPRKRDPAHVRRAPSHRG
jgi:membrane protein YqaA with SNARE-associated domain